MTVTYLMQTDPLADEALFRDLYQTVSPARQAKIDRFILPRDKKLSLAAGLLLQAGLADHGFRESELTMAHHENDKPFIKDHPELCFNIAHSENLAICSFSNQEIGADVEKVTPADLELARRFFDASEYRTIVAAESPTDTFFDYWVLKESYMKATGRGFKLPLDAFRIAWAEDIRVYEDDILRPYHFYHTTVFETFKLAVCVKGEPPAMQLRFLNAASFT